MTPEPFPWSSPDLEATDSLRFGCSLIYMDPLMDVHCLLGIKSGRSDPKKINFLGCQKDNSFDSDKGHIHALLFLKRLT